MTTKTEKKRPALYQQVEVREGYNPVVSPKEDRGFKYIKQFGVLKLTGKETFEEVNVEQETAIVVLSGECDIEAGGVLFEGVGERKTVFDGLPHAVFVPPGLKFKVSNGEAEVALCRAQCEAYEGKAVHIQPNEIKVMSVGKDNWQREVRLIVYEGTAGKRLVIGETINPPGNWSTTPAHKHEYDNHPYESSHEEMYFFKVDKPQGWGFERIYSDNEELNEYIHLTNNTATFMPHFYHQIASAPGYTLHYLFFLAGLDNQPQAFDDPQHRWIKD